MRGLLSLTIMLPLLLISSANIVAQDTETQPPDTASQGESDASYQAYVARSGDTLSNIAQRFNTTVAELKAANELADEGQIVAGQIILAPASSQSYVEVYDVEPGDTLFGISRRFNTTVEILQALNNIPDEARIEAGKRIVVPSVDRATLDVYVVGADDSLFIIAKRFNTTVSDLMSLNGIADERLLEAGARILVPKLDEAQFELYQVKSTDSLYSISKRFAATREELMSLNGIADARAIEAGQTILVPRIDELVYEVYEVVPGDNLFDISRIYNTTVAQLRALNGIEGRLDLTAGRSILVPRVDETLLDRYIVKAGDSLYSIARRYDISILALQALNQLADARDIKAGHVLLAPKLQDALLAVHVVGSGDTLAKIAAAYSTSVEVLGALNGIADPSLIRIADTILVPQAKEVEVRPGFGFGIHVFADAAKAGQIRELVTGLGANWVKVDVSWAEIEATEGVFNYSALDTVLAALELAGLKILLNVFDAPDWSRASYTAELNSQLRGYGGPPADYADFGRFIANMVKRYAGVVDAYEIWKSPNLLKYWTVPVYHRAPDRTDDGDYGLPDEINIGASYYVPLLEIAFDTIKSHDDEALVLTAGLAPAGFTDHYNSIDTDTYLTNMLAAGAADHSDGIGAIFSASAVPPTLSCCTKPPGVDSHYESFLQYFTELLAYYDQTLQAADVELPVYVTQVGWGTRDGANLAIPAAGYEWLNYTSEAEQALYVTQALQIAQKLDYVAAMFLYNLNGCDVGDDEACFFSLIDADSARRPAFDAYAATPKIAEDA